MNRAVSSPIHALLLGLSDDLAREISTPLRTLCSVTTGGLETAAAGAQPHIIFCRSDIGTVRQIRRTQPNAAIVVVSRQPEIGGWLDSIEAGATDYCAAPFEAIQMKWLVDKSLQLARQNQ